MYFVPLSVGIYRCLWALVKKRIIWVRACVFVAITINVNNKRCASCCFSQSKQHQRSRRRWKSSQHKFLEERVPNKKNNYDLFHTGNLRKLNSIRNYGQITAFTQGCNVCWGAYDICILTWGSILQHSRTFTSKLFFQLKTIESLC